MIKMKISIKKRKDKKISSHIKEFLAMPVQWKLASYLNPKITGKSKVTNIAHTI